jgi:type VI secretion system secreted protein VgrG
MGQFTQAERLARFESPLGPDELLLVRFSGEEGISRPFRFHLELVSERRDIDPKDVLRKSGTLSVLHEDGEPVRHINGFISRLSQGTSDAQLTTYWAELVPWLHFLSLRKDCRIFQKLSVPDIVAKVFQDSHYTDFEVQCGRRPEREFCVQYRESDLNFVQRLLEEEGIFYFFKHEADKHTLVLADQNTKFPDCPAPTTVPVLAVAAPQQDAVTSFEWENSIRIGTVTYRDYDHLQPSFTLDGSAPGHEGEEVYEYWPGHYTTREDGERFAKYRLEAEEALREQARGRSSCRNFIGGCKFTLEDHTNPKANQEYVLTSVQHVCNAGDYRSSGATESLDYSNQFTCIPASVPFRPRRSAPKPVITGSQTAVVVGPSGEEIYTDEHGRVKLHFHWDRLGKRDENSSCWIRVSHPWAGQGWGAVSIPRIGQEVVVDFLEGGPDQPLVTGRVYNAQNKPPYGLPDNGMVSGIKSNSTPGGGGFNGIEMNDKKGEEGFSVHAQYNMDTVVENDENHTVHNNRTVVVDVDETRTVHANQKETVDSKRETSIGADDKLTVGANRETSIAAKDTLKVGADLAITGGANITIKSAGNTIMTVGGNFENKATGNTKITAGGKVEISATSIELSATSITLKGGGATIELAGGGVKITAPAIVDIKGAMVKNNA